MNTEDKQKLNVTPDAWRLFYNLFKEGDAVVIVADNDEFLWGKLDRVRPDGCVIKNNSYSREYYEMNYFVPWNEIRFMAHDGFPVKKLMGADGSKSIELLSGLSDIPTAIRASLWSPNRKTLREQEGEEFRRTHIWVVDDDGGGGFHSASFGDPFYVENISMTLLNKGNTGEKYEDDLYEEVIVCKSRDGAMGLLYDLGTIYHFA